MAKIAFWLGRALESIDPLTALSRGVGGSETATIRMAEELTTLGHEVVVYADCVDSIFYKYAGRPLTWIPFGQAKHPIKCDLFVVSRIPEARHELVPACSRAWLWMHDLHVGPDWENLIGTSYDKVLCLSDWARGKFLGHYPAVEPSKVVVTHNAIDLGRFCPGAETAKLERLRRGQESLKVIYASSADRGLDRLLDFWPAISECRLGAELHVYYGFDTWQKLAELRGSHIELHKIATLKARLTETPGVVYHGRVGQVVLAEAFKEAHLWLYPTSFYEVSCIVAMEAQAANCKIVTTRCGALTETAPHAWFVDLPTHTQDFERKFLASVEEAIQDDCLFTTVPRTWASVAKQWDGWISEQS
jgi:glycosyltransferase involved in cell wall biosynthesis